MSSLKNRRTMKKRIRRIMFLCVFITVILFGVTIIFFMAHMFRSQAVVVCEYFSYSIGQDMNSGYFLKQMNINSLEDFSEDSVEAKDWIDNMKNSAKNRSLSTLHMELIRDTEMPEQIKEKITGKMEENRNGVLFGLNDLVSINIQLNGREIYSTDILDRKGPISGFLRDIDREMKKPPGNLFESKLMSFYNIKSSYPLFDSAGEVIGEVSAEINKFLVAIGLVSIIVGIIAMSLLALLFASGLNKLLTARITVPVRRLEESMKAVAQGNYENTMHANITLKKPLREVESIAESTNIIIKKMREYNDLLASQKGELENQNEELEAQNEELTNSRRKLQEAQTMLVQTENMASVGQLTAAILHEVNTPLGAISSNLQISDAYVKLLNESEGVKSDKQMAETIEQIKEANSTSIMASKRISEIIRSLKNFSRLDQAEFQEADIIENIKSVLVLTSNLWKRRINIHEEYESLPLVKCFPGLLNQVFMNIIVNAIQSIQDDGEIYIKAYPEESRVCVSIRDTGSGISEENLGRVFDPGFTTKNFELGMGLGLSICSNIIKKHKGEIKVNSKPGEGSEFVVYIPVAQDAEQL